MSFPKSGKMLKNPGSTNTIRNNLNKLGIKTVT